jgi:tyrosyl-tRNA synthetase
MEKLSVEERFNLVKRNTDEILKESELKKLLEKKENPVVYLGVSITGRPHIGYYLWVLKMADFIKAGFKVKILLADLHGALDNTPWELLDRRYDYYSKVITGMFESVGANLKQLEFVKGSSFQLSKKYVKDLFMMSSNVSVHDSNKAASDVVKMGKNPKLSGLIYPLMQALDEVHLDADVQYGGKDQRKIMVLARENLEKLNYKPRIEVMTPLIPGLTESGKMSSSDPNSKIDLLDNKKKITKKINKAYCPEKQVEDNGVLAFAKFVIFVNLENKGEKFIINRSEKFGGKIEFENYANLESAYEKGELHPMDLKMGLVDEIDKLLSVIREKMQKEEKLIKEAYPNN